MSANIPIVEQIMLNILDTLGDVTTANRYSVTLDVQRASIKGNVDNPELITCVVHSDDATINSEGGTVQSGTFVDKPFLLKIAAYEGEDSEYPVRQTLEMAASDATRALRMDRSRGSVAGVYNTTISEPSFRTPGETQGGADECVLTVTVSYRRTLDDRESA